MLQKETYLNGGGVIELEYTHLLTVGQYTIQEGSNFGIERDFLGYTNTPKTVITEGNISPVQIESSSPFTISLLGNLDPAVITMQYDMGLGKFGADLYLGIAGNYGLYLGVTSERYSKYEWDFDLLELNFDQLINKTVPIWLATTPPLGFKANSANRRLYREVA